MRADQLTFTRFIAAVSIVVFHFGKGAFPFNLFPLNVLFQRAELAVSYFFVHLGLLWSWLTVNRKPLHQGCFF